MIAIIEAKGKQYLIKENSRIILNKTGKAEGEEILFDKVLLLADNGNILIGKPYLDGVKVYGKVLKNLKKKTLIIKYKPKTRYRKKKGYKNYFDEVLIEKIEAPVAQ